MGPEAGKLLTALQEFISSLIVQSQVGQTQRIEVDLDGKPLPQQYHGLHLLILKQILMSIAVYRTMLWSNLPA
jgi:hypothetical protein